MEEEEDNWMTPIIKCLEGEIWPTDKNEASALRMKISQYVMKEGVLFKKSYLSPMLRCVRPLQANYIIREDTKEVVDRFDSCQIHAPVPRLPKTRLTSIMSSLPFYQWGLDILGPLSEGPDKLKFIIVRPPKSNSDGQQDSVGKRPIQELVCKMENQADEHGSGAPVRLGRERVGWVDEFPNILWVHWTMLKTSNGETPFSLTYGSEAVISVEIVMPTYQTIQFNETQNEEEMKLNLDLIQ
ncbi:hypothetical protein Tco_0860337 [Tanacetum coccineum]|uniref:Uncharacterized protein n=1 Tax=Tanacetum coccineum TaxID=301880 RepID=A0ABQ5BEN4_9ASTR